MPHLIARLRTVAGKRRVAWICLWALLLGVSASDLDTASWVVQADRNSDGITDAWQYFDGPGDPGLVLLDADFDGRVDARQTYDIDGNPLVVPADNHTVSLRTAVRCAADDDSYLDDVSADLPQQARFVFEQHEVSAPFERPSHPHDAQRSIYSGRAPPA